MSLQRHGKGTLKTVTGNVYTGEFKGNVFHGSGAMVFCSGDEYSGSWKNGMVATSHTHTHTHTPHRGREGVC